MIFTVGEILILKKAHPCGGNRFRAAESASDVKIECLKCGRRLVMDIDKLLKSVKKREGKIIGEE